MSFGKQVVLFGATFVGVILGHQLIRGIFGQRPRRHHYDQADYDRNNNN